MIREFDTCPICGHHKWCGKTLTGDGSELFFCHYQDGPKGQVITGADGINYICIKENVNGDGWLLVTEEQRKKSRQEWLSQNRNHGNLSECPICHGNYTCAAFDSKNRSGTQMFLCHGIRSGSPKSLISGKDGCQYYLIKQRDDGSWLIQRNEDHKREVEEYKRKQEWHLPDGTIVSASSFQRKQAEIPQEAPTVISVTPRPAVVKEHELEQKLRSNEDLDQAYRAMLAKLRLLPKHRKLLLDSGWTDALIAEYHVVSMPLPDKERWKIEHNKEETTYLVLPWRNELVQAVQDAVGVDLSGIPGFYQLDTCDKETGEIIPKWRLAGNAGILFFSQDIKGHLFGAQIRKDDKREGQSRYTWLSSNPLTTDKNGRQLYRNGTGQPVQAAICYHPERDQSYVAYVTEGFKKGVIGNYYKKAPFIALPGVGQTNAILQNRQQDLIISDYLKSIGTRIIIFAFDADKAENVNVLRHQYRGLLKMKEQGFQIGVADWTMHAAYAKGIDDLLTQGLDCDYELITDQELQRMEDEIRRRK